jgi:hypothetical protein
MISDRAHIELFICSTKQLLRAFSLVLCECGLSGASWWNTTAAPECSIVMCLTVRVHMVQEGEHVTIV